MLFEIEHIWCNKIVVKSVSHTWGVRILAHQTNTLYVWIQCTSYFWAWWSFHMFTGPLFQINLIWYSVNFKTPRPLWKPQSKAVSDKFHVSGGHSKRKSLHNRVHFHRTPAWQIVLIFNTDILWAAVFVVCEICYIFVAKTLLWIHHGYFGMRQVLDLFAIVY